MKRPLSRRCRFLLLTLCALAFAAAVWGSADCGARLADPQLAAAEATRLRHLIYFHFALAQLAVVAAAFLLYQGHRRWKRYYLIISYNEKGLSLNPPGIRMPSSHVFRCHLGNLPSTALPPADAPTLVYPLFMLSGHSSGAKLESLLTAAYAAAGRKPDLYFQPVLGASPWLARAAASHIRPLLPDTQQGSRQGNGQGNTPAEETVGILVVAHGSTLPEPPPEPRLFCRRLRELLPGTEVCLGYFNQEPAARGVLAGMQADHVLLLPFLLTEGVHTARDLPTEEDARACHKTLQRLPVAAALLADARQP